MNLTLDQYLDGFERSARELPAAFEEWDSIDEELRAEYIDQLTWLIVSRGAVLRRALREHRLLSTLVHFACIEWYLWKSRAKREECMGF